MHSQILELQVQISRARAQTLELVEMALGARHHQFKLIRRRVMSLFGHEGLEGKVREIEKSVRASMSQIRDLDTKGRRNEA